MSDNENKNNPDDSIKDDLLEENGGEESEGEGESGKSDAGTMERGEAQLSDGFYAYMNSVGATSSQIAEVLRTWSHLTGKGLLQAIKDFAGRKTRASAHAEVEIAKGKDYSLLHNFMDKIKSMRNDPEEKLTQQQKQNNRHRPGGSGSQGPSM